MTEISLQNGLPFVSVSLSHNGKDLQLSSMLLDTGSAATLFNVEHTLKLDLDYLPNDTLRRVCGVGRSEFVFVKRVDKVKLDGMELENFILQVGDMDYGFSFDGIIGMDFLIQVGAVLDLSNLRILQAK